MGTMRCFRWITEGKSREDVEMSLRDKEPGTFFIHTDQQYFPGLQLELSVRMKDSIANYLITTDTTGTKFWTNLREDSCFNTLTELVQDCAGHSDSNLFILS